MPTHNAIVQIGFPDTLEQGSEIVIGTRVDKYLEAHPNATEGRGSSEGNTFDWELNPQSPAKKTSEGSIPDSECYRGGTWVEPCPKLAVQQRIRTRRNHLA